MWADPPKAMTVRVKLFSKNSIYSKFCSIMLSGPDDIPSYVTLGPKNPSTVDTVILECRHQKI